MCPNTQQPLHMPPMYHDEGRDCGRPTPPAATWPNLVWTIPHPTPRRRCKPPSCCTWCVSSAPPAVPRCWAWGPCTCAGACWAPVLSLAAPAQGDLRLAGLSSVFGWVATRGDGMLQGFWDGAWRAVGRWTQLSQGTWHVTGNWTWEDSREACQQLGYASASPSWSATSWTTSCGPGVLADTGGGGELDGGGGGGYNGSALLLLGWQCRGAAGEQPRDCLVPEWTQMSSMDTVSGMALHCLPGEDQ